MNVRHMVEWGELFIQEGKVAEGQKLLQMAYDYIQKQNTTGRDDLIAICCFVAIIENGKTTLIHCGKDDEHPLFPGTPDERKKLCFECQQWCLERIEKLRCKE